MKIQSITKYTYKGKEYNNLKEIKEVIHNTIGEEVIDTINKKIDIRHKDLILLLDILCSKGVREVLTECLNVKFERYNEFKEETEVVNILDLN